MQKLIHIFDFLKSHLVMFFVSQVSLAAPPVSGDNLTLKIPSKVTLLSFLAL